MDNVVENREPFVENNGMPAALRKMTGEEVVVFCPSKFCKKPLLGYSDFADAWDVWKNEATYVAYSNFEDFLESYLSDEERADGLKVEKLRKALEERKLDGDRELVLFSPHRDSWELGVDGCELYSQDSFELCDALEKIVKAYDDVPGMVFYPDYHETYRDFAKRIFESIRGLEDAPSVDQIKKLLSEKFLSKEEGFYLSGGKDASAVPARGLMKLEEWKRGNTYYLIVKDKLMQPVWAHSFTEKDNDESSFYKFACEFYKSAKDEISRGLGYEQTGIGDLREELPSGFIESEESMAKWTPGFYESLSWDQNSSFVSVTAFDNEHVKGLTREEFEGFVFLDFIPYDAELFDDIYPKFSDEQRKYFDSVQRYVKENYYLKGYKGLHEYVDSHYAKFCEVSMNTSERAVSNGVNDFAQKKADYYTHVAEKESVDFVKARYEEKAAYWDKVFKGEPVTSEEESRCGQGHKWDAVDNYINARHHLEKAKTPEEKDKFKFLVGYLEKSIRESSRTEPEFELDSLDSMER